MNLKHELDKAVKQAFRAAMVKHDVRREYVTDEMLVAELEPWLAELIFDKEVEAVRLFEESLKPTEEKLEVRN